jgi:hypothetical protein
MRKNAILVMLGAVMVSGLTVSSVQPASAHCHMTRSHHSARRVYRRTYVSQRVIRQPVYMSRTISQPAVVERVVTRPAVVQRVIEQPIVVRPARRGLIPGIYRFIFGG